MGSASFGLAATRVEPDSTDISITPGTPFVQSVKMVNENDRAVSYVFSIWGVEFGETADELQFVPVDAEQAGWFSLSAPSIEVPAQGEGEIAVTFAVPAEVESEVQAYALVAQEQGSSEVPGVSVRTGLASLFFVTIGEGQQAQLEIQAFEALPKQTTFLPIRFAALLKNEGEGNVQPAGQVVIRNMLGRAVATLPLSEVPRRVPAKTSRVFAVTWGSEPEGKGLLAEVKNFHIGPYSAQLEVLSADGEAVLTQNTRVVLFPWRTVALGAVLLAILLFILWQGKRRLSR